MGIAFSGIAEDARDEMRYGDSEQRELAARLDAADARERAADVGGQPPVDLSDAKAALAQLRHLYDHMVNGRVHDTAEAARGLLGPSIERIEKSLWRLERG